MDPNFNLTFARVARLVVYFVYAVVVAVLIILVMGFFLRLAGASSEASFVEWVYRNVERAMEPFRGMFPEEELGDGNSVFDASLLFGIAFYAIIALVLHAAIEWLTRQVLVQRRQVAELERHATLDEREADLRRREALLAERERQVYADQVSGAPGLPPTGGIPPSPPAPNPASRDPAGGATGPA